MANSKETSTGRYVLSVAGWPAERWTAIVVLAALALLILIRMGFRGIDVLGASVKVK
jgi:hypothetical protein